MAQSEAAKAIEAILMVAQEPVEPHLLAQLLEVAPARVEELCHELQAAYDADDRGFVLARVAGGYRFQSHAEMAPYVERFVLEGQSARLSSAALETLAIVAYKQPISRPGGGHPGRQRRRRHADAPAARLHRGGRPGPGPGQATLFGTSREFLERLGLDRIEDLPPIADLFPSAEVMEALEQGLRADRPAPAPDAAEAPDGPDDPEGAAGSEPPAGP
ncbi:MAG: SMC-Scp complex subunit ScpB [Acidimicrobiales bacterium]